MQRAMLTIVPNPIRVALALGLLGIAGALAAPAMADVTADVTTLTPQITFAQTTSASYQVKMVSGDDTERFNVAFEAPPFSPLLADQQAGSPLGSPRVNLDGGIGGSGSFLVAEPACSPTNNRFHGFESIRRSVDLTLLPNTTSTLTVTYDTGRNAPWIGTSLAPRVVLSNQRVDRQPGTLPADRVLTPPEPQYIGPRGVKITLSTNPPSLRPGERDGLERRRGEPITISAATDPPLTNAAITLSYYGPENTSTLKPLTTVRTDSNGRLVLPGWRPTTDGPYELWASYASTSPAFTDDYTCPRGLTITPTPGLAITPASATPRAAIAKIVRGRAKTRARVRCAHAELPSVCDFTLRIRRGDRTIGRRKLRLPTGQTKTYTLAHNPKLRVPRVTIAAS